MRVVGQVRWGKFSVSRADIGGRLTAFFVSHMMGSSSVSLSYPCVESFIHQRPSIEMIQGNN